MSTPTPDDSSEKQEVLLEKSYLSIEDSPWIEHALMRAQTLPNTLLDATDSAIERGVSCLSEIRRISSAHYNQTLDSLATTKDQFGAYENLFFGKVKEGIYIAASHPLISLGVAAGLRTLISKKPRRFLFRTVQRLLMSEEALISKADARLKDLHKSIDKVKYDSKVLEESNSRAEEQMVRGRTKLRQAGRQIQGVIHSAYKIEKQARGLKDILRELPSSDGSKFGVQVSTLTADVKKNKSFERGL